MTTWNCGMSDAQCEFEPTSEPPIPTVLEIKLSLLMILNPKDIFCSLCWLCLHWITWLSMNQKNSTKLVSSFPFCTFFHYASCWHCNYVDRPARWLGNWYRVCRVPDSNHGSGMVFVPFSVLLYVLLTLRCEDV